MRFKIGLEKNEAGESCNGRKKTKNQVLHWKTGSMVKTCTGMENEGAAALPLQ